MNSIAGLDGCGKSRPNRDFDRSESLYRLRRSVDIRSNMFERRMSHDFCANLYTHTCVYNFAAYGLLPISVAAGFKTCTTLKVGLSVPKLLEEWILFRNIL